MWWPWRKRFEPQQIPLSVDEWIVVPFRYLEAVRQTVHAITVSEGIPPAIKAGTEEWLKHFNTHLAEYMQEEYGPHVFPLLDRIAYEVWPGDDPDHTTEVHEESWVKWEKELKGE